MPLIGIGVTPRDGGRAASGVLVPTDLAGCVEWYRADNVTLNGGDVSAWPNGGTAGAARDIAQATPALQPLYHATGGPNSQPYVEFDGIGQYLRGTWTQAQPHHVFLVAMISQTDTVGACILDGSSVATSEIYISGHGCTNATAGSAVGVVEPGDAWARIEVAFNGASSRMRVGSTERDPCNAGSNDAGGLTIGCNGSLASYADGLVAEVIRYNRELSSVEITQVHAYLAARYGI